MRAGSEPISTWEQLVPHLIHPIKVSIVEAMIWMDRPLSAKELTQLFDEPKLHYLSNVSYHLRRLAKCNVVELAGTREVRGARQKLYALSHRMLDGQSAVDL